jgi:hypothetical protein
MKKIMVLIVDESALVRQTLTDILMTGQRIEVMGSASQNIARNEETSFDLTIPHEDIRLGRLDKFLPHPSMAGDVMRVYHQSQPIGMTP